MTAYKLLTHDYRPPLQGGPPIWDGATLPYTLPPVRLDTSGADCAPGWHYADRLADAFRLCGLWPSGRPMAILVVEPSADAITRGVKGRASTLTILRRAAEAEIRAGLRDLSIPFGQHADAMADEQYLWYEALGRPRRDRAVVVSSLTLAVQARGLDWTLQEYPSSQDAKDALVAQATRATKAASAAWAAWAAWAASAASAAWAAWAASAAWDARDARDAWDAWDAWDARDALGVYFAARAGWIQQPADVLTLGLRDAYSNGLGLAFPVSPGVLGWALDKP